MPQYGFKCMKCNGSVEISNSMTDPLPTLYCCQEVMLRDYTATAAIFKGDGWAGKS